MELIYLDISPTYVPFVVQTMKGSGEKSNPTVKNLIIYEEGGADSTFDSTTITGSPFTPTQINSKTGMWGVMVPKSSLTAGKFYIALWEMTVDAITTAKIEKYFVCNSTQFSVGLTATAVDAVLDEVVEGTITVRQMLRIFMSVMAGKASGGGTPTITYRDVADTKNRISATVDLKGNRTSVTIDGD